MPPSRVNAEFACVVILTNVEVHARRDKHSVKAFNPSIVKWFTSGTEAVDFLSRNPVDLILCDSTLEDMDGIKFLQLIRNNMNLCRLPVVMVTLENHRHYVLDAINNGCAGYVLRPYSQKTFDRHLSLAKQMETYSEVEELQLEEAKDMVSMGNFDDAIDAFEEIVSIQDEAQRYYDMGCRYLMEQLYGKSIVCFKKALKINDLFAEAYKGLADAYQGKGDEKNYQQYLKKAAEVYAQFDRLEETKQLFIEILKFESTVPNPFNSLGVKLRMQGDYPGAIHAYEQALELTPEDQHIYFNMSKAYYFMGDVTRAGQNVVEALKIDPNFEEAAALYKRLSGKDWKPPQGAPPSEKAGPKTRSAMDVNQE
jgi:tetratricopeptide (TPR) repeat protein